MFHRIFAIPSIKTKQFCNFLFVKIFYRSYHLNKASNDKFSVEFWMVIWVPGYFDFSLADIKIRSGRRPIIPKSSLESKHPEVATNFKTQLWLKNMAITNIQNLTLSLLFDTVSKWHDPDIQIRFFHSSLRLCISKIQLFCLSTLAWGPVLLLE